MTKKKSNSIIAVRPKIQPLIIIGNVSPGIEPIYSEFYVRKPLLKKSLDLIKFLKHRG